MTNYLAFWEVAKQLDEGCKRFELQAARIDLLHEQFDAVSPWRLIRQANILRASKRELRKLSVILAHNELLLKQLEIARA
jgi:hypothetical protein